MAGPSATSCAFDIDLCTSLSRPLQLRRRRKSRFLTLCQNLGASPPVAIASGIGVSIISNFSLNRRFSFSYARDRNWTNQFLGFVVASGVGATVNFCLALYLQSQVLAPTTPHSLQIAALAGVIAGMAFNFIANRYVVFRKRFFRFKE